MTKLLPSNLGQLLMSYFSEEPSEYTTRRSLISLPTSVAGVPQKSDFGPLFYSMYTSEIPAKQNTVLKTFADKTVIITTDAVQEKSTKKLSPKTKD